MTPSDIGTIASAIFAGLSALAAAVAIYFPARTSRSHQTLEQAIISLERAYEVLTSEGTEVFPPASDRLNWLTAARHVERYKSLKMQLADSTHKTICEEQEEYWRHKFYLCLLPLRTFPASYYESKQEEKIGIEPVSALVLFAFGKWPEGRLDPLDTVDFHTLVSDNKVLVGNYGLRGYLEKIPKYAGLVSS